MAVVDTGVDGLHPDLSGQVIDQWFDAWNLQWVTGYDSSWGPVYSPRYGRWYEGSHGTHVAGIIAAKNDGVGISGLAPNVQILSIRIFSPDPVPLPAPYGHYYVGDYKAAVGIIEAVDYGARVLNNSWGGKGYSQTLKAAIDYALLSGAVFVVSMGNSYLDELNYPAGYPGAIAVGATTPMNTKTDFSTMGGHISVGAPGDRVLSCVPRWMTQSGTGQPLLFDYWGGTSMAAPYVSALAAMLLEKHAASNPTPYQIKRLMESTARDIAGPGFDRATGYGLINPVAALTATSLPNKGATLVVYTPTASSPATKGFELPVPYVDVTLRKGGIDRYFGQTDFEGYDSLEFPLSLGAGVFAEIEPGTYEVLVGGEDTTGYWWRVANRVTKKGTITLGPGDSQVLLLTLNTTLHVTLSWSEPVDLDLAILEYDPVNDVYVWSTPKTGALWGTFSSDAQAGGSETYTLGDPHWDYDIYYIAIDATNATAGATATVTVVQNGVTENYGPYSVEAGGFYPSDTWPDWWENTVHPYFQVTGPGGPVVY